MAVKGVGGAVADKNCLISFGVGQAMLGALGCRMCRPKPPEHTILFPFYYSFFFFCSQNMPK